jgi:hypothetical protein
MCPEQTELHILKQPFGLYVSGASNNSVSCRVGQIPCVRSSYYWLPQHNLPKTLPSAAMSNPSIMTTEPHLCACAQNM